MKKYRTEQRKQLIEFFEKNTHRSFSAQDIYNVLCDQHVSMSAIYRNLAYMEKTGIIHKVSGNARSGVFYQYVDPLKCIDVVHLKCEDCDTTLHLNHHISQMIIAYAKEEQNFIINSFGSFLYGKCATCSQNNSTQI